MDPSVQHPGDSARRCLAKERLRQGGGPPAAPATRAHP